MFTNGYTRKAFFVLMAICLMVSMMNVNVAKAAPSGPQSLSVADGSFGIFMAQAKVETDGSVTAWYRLFNPTSVSQLLTAHSRVNGQENVSFAVRVAPGMLYEFVKVTGWYPPLVQGQQNMLEFWVCNDSGECNDVETTNLTGANQGQIAPWHYTNGCLLDAKATDDPYVKFSVGDTLVAEGHLDAGQLWSEAYGSWVDFTEFAHTGGIVVKAEWSWTGFADRIAYVPLPECVPTVVHTAEVSYEIDCTQTYTATASSTPAGAIVTWDKPTTGNLGDADSVTLNATFTWPDGHVEVRTLTIGRVAPCPGGEPGSCVKVEKSTDIIDKNGQEVTVSAEVVGAKSAELWQVGGGRIGDPVAVVDGIAKFTFVAQPFVKYFIVVINNDGTTTSSAVCVFSFEALEHCIPDVKIGLEIVGNRFDSDPIGIVHVWQDTTCKQDVDYEARISVIDRAGNKISAAHIRPMFANTGNGTPIKVTVENDVITMRGNVGKLSADYLQLQLTVDRGFTGELALWGEGEWHDRFGQSGGFRDPSNWVWFDSTTAEPSVNVANLTPDFFVPDEVAVHKMLPGQSLKEAAEYFGVDYQEMLNLNRAWVTMHWADEEWVTTFDGQLVFVPGQAAKLLPGVHIDRNGFVAK